MADLVGAVVALLAADASIAAAVGTRVFGGELPPGETQHMPRRAIVLKPSGGSSLTGASYAEADTQRLDLFAYGATLSEAVQLRDAAAAVLRPIQRTVSARVLIHWAQSAGGFLTGREPVTDWPRAWQSFQFFHSLKEV
jgi:opacity protein-like surface antigen